MHLNPDKRVIQALAALLEEAFQADVERAPTRTDDQRLGDEYELCRRVARNVISKAAVLRWEMTEMRWPDRLFDAARDWTEAPRLETEALPHKPRRRRVNPKHHPHTARRSTNGATAPKEGN